jgi:hypothetical protein
MKFNVLLFNLLKNKILKKIIIIPLILLALSLSAQNFKTPLQVKNYSEPSSYEELSSFIARLDDSSPLLSVETIGKSAKDRNIFALKFSSSEFGKDRNKTRVLIFAQQHGNEQSGKDGALLLAAGLLQAGNRYLLDRLDIILIPLMNPDGSEANSRRNGNQADLNRNHLILTEPETIALHKLYDKFLFEVTMDVHEYSPFGETWKKFGYRDNSEELLGTPTNIMVSQKIRNLANKDFYPYLKKYCADNQVSCFVYAPGGPPEKDYIRHSTFDINDGRQSLAIQNSFSLILEGMNGTDGFSDNIKHRAEAQMTAMRGLLEYSYKNSAEIKKLVSAERKSLLNIKEGEKVAIQLIHAPNGETLSLPLYSYSSGNDTVIIVHNYRPVVKSLSDVTRPAGYLIPKSDSRLVAWAERHAFNTETFKGGKSTKIEQYTVASVDSIDFEGDLVIDPVVKVKELSSGVVPGDYIYIPTAQLRGNMLIIALEPKSMLGLATYPLFAYLVKAGTDYPVLRVVKK